MKNDKMTVGTAVSDLPFHLNIISSIAYGFNNKRNSFMKLNSSFFAGETLAYPFIPNFYSAFLISSGLTTPRIALLVPSVITSWSLIVSFYSLSYYFTRSHIGAMLSIIIFFNLGGLGFLYFFDKECKSKTIDDYVSGVCGGEKQFYWFHPITNILIPQRAALFSFPLLFWAYLCLLIGITYKNMKMMILSAILTGLMPQVQLHSFVCIAQWSIIYFILNLKIKGFKEYFFMWFVYGLVSCLIGIPQCFTYFNRISSHSFLSFSPIWNDPLFDYIKGPKPISLWFSSLGACALISLIICWFVLNKQQKMMYIPSLIIFLSANFIRYQPWVMDNTKIFYAGWIPFAVPAASYFFTYLLTFRKNVVKNIMSFTVFIVLFLITICSGFLTTIMTFSHHYDLGAKDYFQFGLWVAENTPVDAVFGSESTPQNSISMIGGRQLYVGYGGWIHSHGLDMRPYWDFLYNAKEDDDDEWFSIHKISYMGNVETTSTKFKPIDLNNWTLVYNDGTRELFKLVSKK